MPEREDYKTSLDLISMGDNKKASAILLSLYQKTNDVGLKLKSILALVVSLNRISDNEKLIEISGMGIKIAHRLGEYGSEAYLMAERANFLMDRINFLIYKKRNLNLTPGWFAFSLILEQEKYEALVKEIEGHENEIEFLLRKSLEISELYNDMFLKGNILIAQGMITGDKLLQIKTDFFTHNKKMKYWIRFHFLHQFEIESILFFNKEQRKNLRDLLSALTSCFLESAQYFKATNSVNEAYSFYNLANQLNTIGKFKDAEKYRKKSEIIARNHNDSALIKRVIGLKVIIKNRHRDVPNYLVGEIREEI